MPIVRMMGDAHIKQWCYTRISIKNEVMAYEGYMVWSESRNSKQRSEWEKSNQITNLAKYSPVKMIFFPSLFIHSSSDKETSKRSKYLTEINTVHCHKHHHNRFYEN